LPSRVVVAAPTFIYALLNSEISLMKDNQIGIIGICIGIYFLASFIRVRILSMILIDSSRVMFSK